MTGQSTRGWFVALTVIVVLVGAPGRSASAETTMVTEAGDELTWHDCVYQPDKRSVVRCGRLFIAGPTPASLPIVVVQHDRTGPSESAILFLQGGPGGASWLEPQQFAWPSWARAAGLTQDLVVYDQRGTGLAHPSLTCPEVQDVVRRSLALGWFSEQTTTLFEEATAACHSRLVAEGHDLEQFTTLRNAADVVALMDALPYSDWTLFGTSYGSRLALEVMRMQPIGLRSVVLDGVLPPDLDWGLEEPALLDDAIAKIGAVCSMRLMDKPTCDSSAEDFHGSLESVLERFSERQRWISVDHWPGDTPYKVRVNSAVLLYALHSAMTSPDGANAARDAIMDAAQGDYMFLDLLLDSWAYGQISYDIHDPVFFRFYAISTAVGRHRISGSVRPSRATSAPISPNRPMSTHAGTGLKAALRMPCDSRSRRRSRHSCFPANTIL